SAAALNGDMSQNAREKTINRLKKGELTILIATDVAARGIDVERVTHVINYDIPYDVDSYVHRIGRTGRAGRTGKAILFVTPREQRLFRDIEHHIKKSIKRIDPPSIKEIHEKRVVQLQEKIVVVLDQKKNELETTVTQVKKIAEQLKISPQEVAAALILLNQEAWSSSNDTFDSKPTDFSKRERKGERYKSFGGEKKRDRFRDRGKSKGRPGDRSSESSSRDKSRDKPSSGPSKDKPRDRYRSKKRT
ncbi:MAG: ATP-dependent RNA helicase, partial [Gammaproteobacteria bacterium CG_4_9_14_3_um_filter_38_9]